MLINELVEKFNGKTLCTPCDNRFVGLQFGTVMAALEVIPEGMSFVFQFNNFFINEAFHADCI